MPEYTNALSAGELIIRRKTQRADATPFLAHCDLAVDQSHRLFECFRTFLAGDASRLPAAFRNWPLTTVWAFATALSDEYGEDGAAVYRILDKAFDVEISIDVRAQVSAAFRSVCRKHGLSYDPSGRYVDDYLAQAGISRAQLHYVAKAFLLAERAFGPAPLDNTLALNSWEDDAASYLPFGIRIARMVLEVDQTAHYAFLLTRYRQKIEPRNAFETLFFDELQKAESLVSSGSVSAEAVPRPSLTWSQNNLALAIPKLEGRLSISVAGEQRKLRGGQNWPLPTPWPSSISWSLRERSDVIPVFQSDQHLLAFERESGRLIAQINPADDSDTVIDAREVMLVATAPFAIDGQLAFEIGVGGFASYCVFGVGPIKLEIGSHKLNLRAKPKPRIWIDRGSIAKGSKGHLLGQMASLAIEFGDVHDTEFDVALSVGSKTIIEPLATSEPGGFTLYDLAELAADQSELMPLRAELRLRGSNRTLVRFKAWLWAGLRELKDGFVFDGDQIPSNYASEQSRHIIPSSSGQLCLDRDAAYEKAILVFWVGHDRVDFDIPRPGVSLSLTDGEGRSLPLKIGDTVILRDEDKGGSLSIRCPDRQAKLNVRGREELIPFKQQSTRVLSIADLLAPSAKDEITLHQSGARNAPILLVRVVPAICPRQFSIAQRAETLELTIEMQIDVDAIRIILEDETGFRMECDCALAYQPVAHRPPDWLRAQLDTENTKRFVITVDLRNFYAELSLASILVRPTGTDGFRPLRNVRGDNYAVALKTLGASDAAPVSSLGDQRLRFMTLNAWMSECFAQESWDQVGDYIKPKWMSIGKQLADKPDGCGQLLLAAHQPALADAARSWVPLAHPLQIVPSLYGSPASSFLSLASNPDEGSEHLVLLAEVSKTSIQDVHRKMGLSPAFLMAFANFNQVSASFQETRYHNAILRDFDFKKYQQLFEHLDTNPGARWFWQPGDELLGPAHYGAALGRMIDRLHEAGLEEEDSNDLRIRAATSLAHSAFMLKSNILPMPNGIEESHAVLEWAPAFLSGFGQASRQRVAEAYLQNIADKLRRPLPYVIADASFLIRLAPELLAYYLVLWELAERKPQ